MIWKVLLAGAAYCVFHAIVRTQNAGERLWLVIAAVVLFCVSSIAFAIHQDKLENSNRTRNTLLAYFAWKFFTGGWILAIAAVIAFFVVVTR